MTKLGNGGFKLKCVNLRINSVSFRISIALLTNIPCRWAFTLGIGDFGFQCSRCFRHEIKAKVGVRADCNIGFCGQDGLVVETYTFICLTKCDFLDEPGYLIHLHTA